MDGCFVPNGTASVTPHEKRRPSSAIAFVVYDPQEIVLILQEP